MKVLKPTIAVHRAFLKSGWDILTPWMYRKFQRDPQSIWDCYVSLRDGILVADCMVENRNGWDCWSVVRQEGQTEQDFVNEIESRIAMSPTIKSLTESK